MKRRQAQVLLALWLAATAVTGRADAQQSETKPEAGVKPPEEGTVKPEKAEPKVDEASATPDGKGPDDKGKEEGKPSPEAADAKAEPKADEADKLNIEVHAGAYIYFYQPLPRDPPPTFDLKPFLELYFAHLSFDGSIGPYGFHAEGRIRDTKLYDYYPSNVWIEEGYAYYKHKYATVKAGKVYTKFGKSWDNSFFGNIHFYDGLKLDPDLGISVEGLAGEGRGIRFGYSAQYFWIDGRMNGSLPTRDTVSVPDSRRRHSVVARVEPAYFFKDDVSLTLGGSAQYFQADIALPTVGKQNVFRVGGDLTFVWGPWSIYGEFTKQIGQSVTDYPIATIPATMTTAEIPGKGSADNNYVLAGTEVKLWKFTARYNWSFVDYHAPGDDPDLGVVEWMSVAGLGFDMHPNINLLAEHVYWRRTNPGSAGSILDHSLDVSLYAHF